MIAQIDEHDPNSPSIYHQSVMYDFGARNVLYHARRLSKRLILLRLVDILFVIALIDPFIPRVRLKYLVGVKGTANSRVK